MELKCCKGKNDVEVVAIAKETGISVQAVHQFLKRRGVKPSRRRGAYRRNDYSCYDVVRAYEDWRPRWKSR